MMPLGGCNNKDMLILSEAQLKLSLLKLKCYTLLSQWLIRMLLQPR